MVQVERCAFWNQVYESMSFSGDDDEGGLGAAKDAALDKVQDLFAAGKEKMDKVGWQNSYAFEASNAKPPLNY